jgi:hypothetical protein
MEHNQSNLGLDQCHDCGVRRKQVANPTTNYGFVLPTPTDLVTDLPADFDVALQGVDTRLKALQPGTTLGDLAYSSATADTNTRLGIGTAGQVLQVNSGATAPEWAAPAGGGGMTLISTTTLSGASVTLSSIPQTYNSLFMVFNRLTNSTADGKFYLNPNAAGATARASGVEDGTAFSYGYGALFQTQNNWDRTNADNGMSLRIDNYTAALNYNKAFVWSGYYFNANPYAFITGGILSQSSGAVTSIVLSNTGGNWAGGTVLLYGVK